MDGFGGLNPLDGGLTIGLVQMQVPRVNVPADLIHVSDKICQTIRNAKHSFFRSLDLLVFPEYSLQGLNPISWTNDDNMVTLDGPIIGKLKAACAENRVWGCFSLMEKNPHGAPFNSGIIVNDSGEVKLYYRKMHPWVPDEPWEPGDIGVPVCDGPRGSKLALIICHDGMFPEMAREAAYKGANVILRTAGYTFPLKTTWNATNTVNAFVNLAYTASVCLAGDDGSGIPSMGEAMIVDFEGSTISKGDASPDRVVVGTVYPERADEARKVWAAENNIYQLGHRGFTARQGGATDAPYTWMQDLVAGRYRLPWEDEVQVTDGTVSGYGKPHAPGEIFDSARAGLAASVKRAEG